MASGLVTSGYQLVASEGHVGSDTLIRPVRRVRPPGFVSSMPSGMPIQPPFTCHSERSMTSRNRSNKLMLDLSITVGFILSSC
jgi:hypothetical protein